MNQADQQVIELANFKFGTLRKFMHPIYTALNHSLNDPIENKKENVRHLIRDFFCRMRFYRNKSLEVVAKHSGYSIEHVTQFEAGELTADKQLELGYCHACGGEDEWHFFAQQLHEYMNPKVKDSKDIVAKAIYQQYGIIFSGVKRKDIFTKKGVVLELKKPQG